jgi:KaiC/GvpD/RAD55 family RecA-like ATPase
MDDRIPDDAWGPLPTAQPSHRHVDEPATARRRSAFTRESLATIEPRETGYLVKGLLPPRGVAFFAGPSTSAKTFLAIEACLRVARGEPVCGRRTRQAGVVYVAAEDADGVRRRVKAWRMRYGDHGAFQMIPEPPDLRSADVEAELSAVIAEAARELDAEGAPLGLIVFDTLSKIAPGADQNASGDMGALMATLDRIHQRFGVLVLVIAHTPKDETRGISGWYGQFGAADAVIMLTRDTDDDKLRIATVVKLKNGQDGGKIAFRLDEIEIGVDEDGDPITSCTVAFEDPPARTTKGKPQKQLTPGAKIVWNALTYLIDNDQTEPAPQSPGVPPGKRAVQVEALRARALHIGLGENTEKKEAIRQQWRRAKMDLLASEKARLEGDLIWPV